MSLRLLIDEDTQNRLLVHLLRSSGHDVLTINEVALMGEPDPVILDFARENNRILLTRNCQDFQALHQANPNHFGILGIYHDRNFSKVISEKEDTKYLCPLNPPMLGDFEIRTPQTWGAGGHPGIVFSRNHLKT